MKKHQLFPFVVVMFLLAACSGGKELKSYEPGCEQIVANIEAGVVNGIGAEASQAAVNKQFPCATRSTEEGSTEDCGGGVFYEKHNFYFHTGQDFIAIKYPFEGIEKPRIITTGRSTVIENFGKPVRTEERGKFEYLFFEMDYGSLIVALEGGKSRNFIMHAKDPEEVELCD